MKTILNTKIKMNTIDWTKPQILKHIENPKKTNLLVLYNPSNQNLEESNEFLGTVISCQGWEKFQEKEETCFVGEVWENLNKSDFSKIDNNKVIIEFSN